MWMRRVADPEIHATPDMCYLVKFGSSATKDVRINRREPQKVRSAGARPLGWDRGWPPKTKLPLHVC